MYTHWNESVIIQPNIDELKPVGIAKVNKNKDGDKTQTDNMIVEQSKEMGNQPKKGYATTIFPAER